MKGNKILTGMLVTILCLAVVCAAASAADAQPGSEGDPVVTRSYVDKRIGEVMRVLDNDGSSATLGSEELIAQIEYAVKNHIQTSGSAAFAPVSLEMGQTIYGGEGAEMILRTGIGHIVTSTDTVVNATTGIDLKNGAPVPKGNLLIFPRDDGRGIRASDRCWFLVKGAYTIE